MPTLAETQRLFAATLEHGPAALVPGLFAGNIDRIMLGLKAHANSISHARLVALEESFPLTCAAMGSAEFNLLSRAYGDTATAKAADIADIGLGLPAYLDAMGHPVAIGDLAGIERAWLISYHAADAAALDPGTIAAMAQADLLALPVMLHPAARLCPLRAPMTAALANAADVDRNAAAILVARPLRDVRLVALDAVTAALAQRCAAPTTVGNLLAAACEHCPDTDPAGPVMILVSAGALVILE